MIQCIFTIDYEIYGNGQGSLKELVYDPAQGLKRIFDEAEAKFVVFVEAAELERIDTLCTDSAIADVKRQVKKFHEEGFEIALHLHPQWCNAQYRNSKWELDYTEYNLCTLSNERIAEIVSRSIAYLRKILDRPDFSPLSFRAGNWLLQPTAPLARELTKNGVKIDSSVFKGGRRHKLDYRRAMENGSHWMFSDDVTIPDPHGQLLEIPIYTTMVPFWEMVTSKRLHLQHKSMLGGRTFRDRLSRCIDLMQFKHPLKFDFCRMTLDELIKVVETLLREDKLSPEVFKPIVAIGHTKDLVDFDTIESFLSYLRRKGISISTLEEAAKKCREILLSAPNAASSCEKQSSAIEGCAIT